ncbi:MAG: chitinase [Kribbellaceae bacterium]|nr:chitinase [Kribbellaceae bacterium]
MKPPAHRPQAAVVISLIAVVMAFLVPGSASAATNLVTNAGFETGTLSGWNCPAGGVTTSAPHSGSYALSATPSGSDIAQCSQTIAVQPNTAYTLSAWVKGSNVYLGVVGGPSTWTTSSGWSQLTVPFTSTAATVTIYVHSWYALPAYQADDVVLDGPGGAQDTTPPSTPGGLTVGSPTSSSLQLTWSAASDANGIDHYDVVQGTGSAQNVGNVTSWTATGLAAATTYSFKVRACDPSGNCSPYGAAVSGTTSEGGSSSGSLPAHVLTGYWQNFNNGATVQKISDVPAAYDLIAVAFADADASRAGAITFNLDSAGLGGYTVAQFKADIAAKQAAGKKVILSVGGQNGTISVADPTAAANFASSALSMLRTYGFDGIDIDLENGVNAQYMGQALRSLQSQFGSGLVITMAPQTIDMQGTSTEYFKLALAIKDILTIVNVQYYNSGSMNGCNGQVYSQGSVDFITAQACIMLQNGLRPDQVGLGLPASSQAAGSGYVSPTVVNNALDCLTKGTGCGAYKPSSPWPSLRGAMTWSTNWDATNGNQFASQVGGHVHGLP